MPERLTRFVRQGPWLLGFLLIAGWWPGGRAEARRDITIEDLVTIRDIQTMALSPDGTHVAFQSVERDIQGNDFAVKWHIAATTPGAPTRVVGTGSEPLVQEIGGYLLGGDIVWTPDGKWIYFTKKQDGSIQIWRSAWSAPDAQQVTHQPGDILTMRMGAGGERVFFSMGRTHDEIAALKEQGAREGYLEQNPPLYYVSHGPVIPPCSDGKVRSVEIGDDLACLRTNWAYDIQTESVRPATEAELAALPAHDDDIKTIASIGVELDKTAKKMQTPSPDGKQLAWIENVDPDVYKGVFPPMVLAATHEGKAVRCPAPECVDQDLVGFGGLWWHPSGKEIIFKVNNDPHQSLSAFYAWAPDEKDVRTILRSDDSFSSCEITGRRLICGHETWTSPKQVVALDVETGKVNPLVDINPEFRNITFTKVEKILGEDDYGHEVYGHLVYPKDYREGRKYPLVVTQYHSYGFLRGATGHEQPIHAYARDGIAVLSLDHRQNKADYNKTVVYPGSNLTHFRNLYLKAGPATAVENMIDKLVQRGIADPARIGITGFSYGDQVLSTVLLRRNYAAASSAGLQTVPVHNLLPYSSATAKAFNEIFGEPFTEKGLEMRVEYSLEARAGQIDTPILMNVTDKEAYGTLSIYYALDGKGKTVEMFTYPDELHVKWQPAHNAIIYHRNLDWFNFWLRGVEDDDPEKTAQYERWRGLRARHESNIAP